MEKTYRLTFTNQSGSKIFESYTVTGTKETAKAEANRRNEERYANAARVILCEEVA